jgi:hypothetical protein
MRDNLPSSRSAPLSGEPNSVAELHLLQPYHVMPGLVPGHPKANAKHSSARPEASEIFGSCLQRRRVDGRDKPGNDAETLRTTPLRCGFRNFSFSPDNPARSGEGPGGGAGPSFEDKGPLRRLIRFGRGEI